MFGGANDGNIYCDLWKYDVTLNQWTWIKGPGISNQFGIYGSLGIPNSFNNPGSRAETAASWVDDEGNFWMFGGHDHANGVLNDLWKYNISSNTWTWMKGSDLPDQFGVWGIKGLEDATNTPEARWVHARWKDSHGNFWTFGGYNPGGSWNDLWRFNPSTNNWTWMSGNEIPAPGINGTTCNPNSINLPQDGLECRAAWIDANDNLWAYLREESYSNSLWMYCMSTNEWAVIKIDSLNLYGTWGTKGISAPSNFPPLLMGSIGWTDHNGHLYMFGGATTPVGKWHNALWMFTIDPCCTACGQVPPVQNISVNDICPGTCLTVTNNSQGYSSYQWQFPGGNPSSSNNFNPPSICYNTPGNYAVTLIASGCNVVDTITSYLNVFPYPPPQSIIQSGDTLFANTGSDSYQWYFNGNIISGATDYYYVADESGNYNVVATDANGCEVEAVLYNVIASDKTIFSEKEELIINPNPTEGMLKIICRNSSMKSLTIFNVVGEIVYSALLNQQNQIDADLSFLEGDVYFLRIEMDEKSYLRKLIKI